MIKTVIFDIDSTLYSYEDAHPVAFQALTDYAVRHLGVTAEEFAALHKRAQAIQKQRLGMDCASIHTRLIRYQIILELLGRPIARAWDMEKLYWLTLVDNAVPSPGALACMQALKQRGIRIGIGTDMTAGWQYYKLEKLGLLPLVDFMVTSEEVLEEKPSPRLFSLCLEKAGCAPEECAFVGDNLSKDIAGARRVGMVPVWYHPQGPKGDDPDLLAATHLGELIPLLQISAPD